MTARLRLTRVSPLTTIQDEGRSGLLRHGISAGGAMDRNAYARAGTLAGSGLGGIEFTASGLTLEVLEGRVGFGTDGGHFRLLRNDETLGWPASGHLEQGDRLSILPGHRGNYGYLRFSGDLLVPSVMGSLSTSIRAHLGGLGGRALRVGDEVRVGAALGAGGIVAPDEAVAGPIRVVWGLHADLFTDAVRQRFVAQTFTVSPRLDRMGVRLDDKGGVFTHAAMLALVSDAVVPGDIQILGDGTPIVLMRDHQPTGGYPRIATIISADLDRFAQMRPRSAVEFRSVTVEHAQALRRSQYP